MPFMVVARSSGIYSGPGGRPVALSAAGIDVGITRGCASSLISVEVVGEALTFPLIEPGLQRLEAVPGAAARSARRLCGASGPRR